MGNRCSIQQSEEINCCLEQSPENRLYRPFRYFWATLYKRLKISPENAPDCMILNPKIEKSPYSGRGEIRNHYWNYPFKYKCVTLTNLLADFLLIEASATSHVFYWNIYDTRFGYVA